MNTTVSLTATKNLEIKIKTLTTDGGRVFFVIEFATKEDTLSILIDNLDSLKEAIKEV